MQRVMLCYEVLLKQVINLIVVDLKVRTPDNQNPVLCHFPLFDLLEELVKS